MKNSRDQPSPSLAGTAMERILEDQKEFEKEHQFMQVCVRSYLVFFLLFCFIIIIRFKQFI